MISLSTCTTVSSTWSGQIAITFLGTFEGCRYAPRVFRIDQNFIYSFVLILQFFSWASCPCPNHCCLALVSLHTANKNKIRIPHCHRPIQIPRVLEAKASRQHLHLRPWQWHCYHPAFLSLAQHSLLRYLFRQYMVGQSCSRQEMCRRSSGKENKLHKHNPILILKITVL